jgi:hypothetical protein
VPEVRLPQLPVGQRDARSPTHGLARPRRGGWTWAKSFALPTPWTAGTTVDIAALSWEDPPAAKSAAEKPSLHLAPLMLPPLKVGAVRAPAPGGVSLIGTF